jgi:hypothetical protein
MRMVFDYAHSAHTSSSARPAILLIWVSKWLVIKDTGEEEEEGGFHCQSEGLVVLVVGSCVIGG